MSRVEKKRYWKEGTQWFMGVGWFYEETQNMPTEFVHEISVEEVPEHLREGETVTPSPIITPDSPHADEPVIEQPHKQSRKK